MLVAKIMGLEPWNDLSGMGHDWTNKQKSQEKISVPCAGVDPPQRIECWGHTRHDKWQGRIWCEQMSLMDRIDGQVRCPATKIKTQRICMTIDIFYVANLGEWVRVFWPAGSNLHMSEKGVLIRIIHTYFRPKPIASLDSSLKLREMSNHQSVICAASHWPLPSGSPHTYPCTQAQPPAIRKNRIEVTDRGILG